MSTPLLVSVLSVAAFVTGPAQPQDKPSREDKKESIKSYDEVLPPDEVVSDPGLVLVHTKGQELFYELSPNVLGKDLLWVTQIAGTGAGAGYGGSPVTDRVVRWELRDETVLLREVDYSIRAEGDDPIGLAVAATSIAPIIEAFPVKAWGKDRSPVIDVTGFFKGDPAPFSPKRRLNASRVDEKRSFIESVKSFPTNVEAKVLSTYELEREEGRRRAAPEVVTVLLHHSMVALPEEPMASREQDPRVGFFSVSFEDYASQEHEVDEVRYVTRWRLEKKDPAAELSEPVQPIVFYVGRGVPERWRPWVKQGIESWQEAFEAAGFQNAILAKDPPSRSEDPDWDAEDARYSVIRWLPSTVENAMGPHVSDPRTGEILEADILMYHNVVKLCRDWYFVQASPCDPRAQKLPMPDELVGELLAYVVAHEVGHSLGFPHNMKASSSFTVEELRDPAFTAVNGVEASIMDYGRFNYVAQPGDGARLIPKIGPYDEFAVEWGYRQFADEEAERAGLAAIVARQKEDPTLLFGGPNPGEDPSQQTEDLGSDPIAATTLGLANLDRVAGYLVEATCEPGEDYRLLRNMYDQLHSQRERELMHVASLVGGFRQRNLFYGDADIIWNAVPVEEQKAAVDFLVERAFQAPAAFVTPEILYRLETSGAADRVLRGQQRILGSLLDEPRIKRMAEQEVRTGAGWKAADMLARVSEGVWSELRAAGEIGLYRRNLQRVHVELLSEALQGEDAASDRPALARGELERIQSWISGALGASGEGMTRFHLLDLEQRIDAVLEPRSATTERGALEAAFDAR